MNFLKKHFRILILLCLAGFSYAVWSAVFYYEGRRSPLVTFFDVGQGDAIFIEAPNGNQILIDGGPGNAILAKIGRTLPFWDRSIDLLVLTHPHADHLDGLLEVLKRYRVDAVVESGVFYSLSEYQEWRDLLAKKKVKVVAAKRGEEINTGSGVLLTILTPFEDMQGDVLKNPHDANVVSRLTHGENSLLFMGDAERMIEYRLLFEEGDRLDSDVLKIGHHGSKTSSTEEFLRMVSPDIAVIQAGRKNRYGHPASEVVDRLASVGAAVLRNDLDGDIVLESDGKQFFRRK